MSGVLQRIIFFFFTLRCAAWPASWAKGGVTVWGGGGGGGGVWGGGGGGGGHLYRMLWLEKAATDGEMRRLKNKSKITW